MDQENEKIDIDLELRCPSRAWTDGREDINEPLLKIVSVFNDLIEKHDMSGAAITFVLHKLTQIYVEAMFGLFKDDDSRSSIYVMSAQMMNASMDTYERLRAKMPDQLLRLLEEPTQGDA